MNNTSTIESIETPPAGRLLCGTSLVGADSGRCKNSRCGRLAAVLLSGYCLDCAADSGLNPLRSCGCKPIRLEQPQAGAK